MVVPGAQEELDGAIAAYRDSLDRFEAQLPELEQALAEAEQAEDEAKALVEAKDDAEDEAEAEGGAEMALAAAKLKVTRAAEAVDEATGGLAEVASRLAGLHRNQAGDPEKAEEVLDVLVSARPDDIRLRLARYEYYRELYDERKAAAELQEALRLAPEDLSVRLTAARHALHRGDPAAARAHLEAVPRMEDSREDAVRRLVGGMIDFAEDRRIMAMERWREALVDVQGSNAELTWWLAYVHDPAREDPSPPSI